MCVVGGGGRGGRGQGTGAWCVRVCVGGGEGAEGSGMGNGGVRVCGEKVLDQGPLYGTVLRHSLMIGTGGGV